ncbi:hypothetical protein HXX76_016011 [Chlamydomonas incerta]|uniref:Uncharacterized protein n=1 Tax=Chlamydomonas incerta TaxID=51695 RepID=A0A835VR50_CHLIN|nr:hypothetical protein HXX76_016011 [Chlamydomonas incerta]|eukprot:KAG2422441.1 hypothetical protein HXX76_016011 [Chlamydomonas incerta]
MQKVAKEHQAMVPANVDQLKERLTAVLNAAGLPDKAFEIYPAKEAQITHSYGIDKLTLRGAGISVRSQYLDKATTALGAMRLVCIDADATTGRLNFTWRQPTVTIKAGASSSSSAGKEFQPRILKLSPAEKIAPSETAVLVHISSEVAGIGTNTPDVCAAHILMHEARQILKDHLGDLNAYGTRGSDQELQDVADACAAQLQRLYYGSAASILDSRAFPAISATAGGIVPRSMQPQAYALHCRSAQVAAALREAGTTYIIGDGGTMRIWCTEQPTPLTAWLPESMQAAARSRGVILDLGGRATISHPDAAAITNAIGSKLTDGAFSSLANDLAELHAEQTSSDAVTCLQRSKQHAAQSAPPRVQLLGAGHWPYDATNLPNYMALEVLYAIHDDGLWQPLADLAPSSYDTDGNAEYAVPTSKVGILPATDAAAGVLMWACSTARCTLPQLLDYPLSFNTSSRSLTQEQKRMLRMPLAHIGLAHGLLTAADPLTGLGLWMQQAGDNPELETALETIAFRAFTEPPVLPPAAPVVRAAPVVGLTREELTAAAKAKLEAIRRARARQQDKEREEPPAKSPKNG